MGKISSILWLGTFTAAGSAIGLMANRRKPACGGLIGAAAGVVAGSVFNMLHENSGPDDDGRIKYYSKSLPSYGDPDEVGYI